MRENQAGTNPWRTVGHEIFGSVRESPALGLYLLALATLGFKWLSPLESLADQAILSDAIVALAVVAWMAEAVSRPDLSLRPRLFHVAVALYVLAGVVSMAFALDAALALHTVVTMMELALLALLTSYYAREPRYSVAITWTVAFVVIYTFALAIAGLALFYGGVDTSLLGAYGEQYIASDSYARIAAGFYSPPLLGSFCIFGSAIIARDKAGLSSRFRVLLQICLSLLVLMTLSRAVIGFGVALVIRLIARPNASRRLRWTGGVAIVAALCLMAALTVGRLTLDPTRPSSITYEVPDPGNRREAAATSFDTLVANPLVGEGPGALTGENRGAPFRAHLTPLNIAATMGLPALAAGAFLLLALWRGRRRPTPIATWSGIAGLGVDGLAGDVDHFRHLWVMLGLADADRNQPSKKSPEPVVNSS